jgi:hypothetical protein
MKLVKLLLDRVGDGARSVGYLQTCGLAKREQTTHAATGKG